MAETIETESQRLTLRVSAILELLTATPDVSAQTSDLGQMWQTHLESLERASEFIVSNDVHFASFLRQFKKEANAVMQLFACLSPMELYEGDTDSQILRVREALSEALRFLSREEATVIPLVRRWSSTREIRSPRAS